MNQFNSGQYDVSGDYGFEAKHQSDMALNSSVILFNPVIQIWTFPDRDRLQFAPGAILQAICRVAGNDSFTIGLTAVDDDTIWSPMAG